MADAGAGPDASDGGIYTLLIDLSSPADVEFGAAGVRDLAPGRYAYTGSALGPGGFARVARHRRIARGEHDARHWHVDHLLGHPDARLAGDVRTPGVAAECAVTGVIARADGVDPVPGVGSSDCGCGSHLAFAGSAAALDRAVRRAHELARAERTVFSSAGPNAGP